MYEPDDNDILDLNDAQIAAGEVQQAPIPPIEPAPVNDYWEQILRLDLIISSKKSGKGSINIG